MGQLLSLFRKSEAGKNQEIYALADNLVSEWCEGSNPDHELEQLDNYIRGVEGSKSNRQRIVVDRLIQGLRDAPKLLEEHYDSVRKLVSQLTDPLFEDQSPAIPQPVARTDLALLAPPSTTRHK